VFSLFFSSPVLQALKDQVIKECVVGPRHVAFLLEVSYEPSSNGLHYSYIQNGRTQWKSNLMYWSAG